MLNQHGFSTAPLTEMVQPTEINTEIMTVQVKHQSSIRFLSAVTKINGKTNSDKSSHLNPLDVQ